MASGSKPLVWLEGEIKTPPFSREGRLRAGSLLRRLQEGETLGPPESRPMPSVGQGCHELRIRDRDHSWRILYHIAEDAIVILDIFSKKSGKTPMKVRETCRDRLAQYRKLMEED
jgi:phage-related protein